MKKLLLIGTFSLMTCIQGVVYIEDAMFILKEIEREKKALLSTRYIGNFHVALKKINKLIGLCEQSGEHTIDLQDNVYGNDKTFVLNCSELADYMWETIEYSQVMDDLHGWANRKVPVENAHRIEDSWRTIMQHQNNS